jgi:hypothetical protein
MLPGLFTHEGWDHPWLIRAREQGDPQMLERALRDLTLPNGHMNPHGYERISRVQAHNQITLEGKKRQLDLITGVVSNTGLVWYLAEFSSDSTPTESWNGNFGAVSGGNCTEFTGYTAATRPVCAFTAATGTSTVSTTNTTRASITISAGVTASVYGIVLTNNGTKNYSAGAALLLRAARYPAPIHYAAGQVYTLAFELNDI